MLKDMGGKLIHQCLRSFVEDSVNFRSNMAIRNAIISGPFALGFFQKDFHETMDIFLKQGSDADLFMEYLESQEGYQEDLVRRI